MKLSALLTYRQDIIRIAEKYGVVRVQVFGSTATGHDQASSDVDLIARLADNRTLLDAGGFQYEVEKLIGCRVDVIPVRGDPDDNAELLAFLNRVSKETVEFV
jgi:predicted nucleotidyltransferase